VLSAIEWDGATYHLARLTRELRIDGKELECRFGDSAAAAVVVRELPVVRSPEPAQWAQRLTVAAARAFADDREQEAIALLERAVAVDPACADAYESLGVIYGRHGEYERAIELMEQLLEVDPRSVMAHTNLSLYHNQLGRIEDAEREAALAMRAQMQRENEERDRAAAAEREAEEAAADRRRRAGLFQQVLDLDPDDALANFGLGELCVEQGEFDRAVDHLQRALAADPKHSAAILALGRAHEGAGRRDEARSTYRDGIDIAAARGDLKTAKLMRERLVVLDDADGG
jgi:tetratricopeptide (TPR) repeat protein